jgi:transcriptional regulator with XRE-family HTH domain
MELSSEENLIRERVSGIFRAARKLRGLKQAEMAKLINVSQSAISKFESGTLMPDTHKWYQFCQSLGLDADLTYRSGYVFSTIPRDSYKKSNFKFGKKPSTSLIKAKECIPFINSITKMEQKFSFEDTMKKNGIDIDIFRIVDFNIPVSVLAIIFKFMNSNIGQYEKMASKAFIEDLDYFLPSSKLTRNQLNTNLPKTLQSLEASSEIARFSKKGNKIKIEINKNFAYTDSDKAFIEKYLKYKSTLTKDILKSSKQVKDINVSKKSTTEYIIEYAV